MPEISSAAAYLRHESSEETQPDERKCNDVFWAVFFWAHFAGMVAMIVMALTNDEHADAGGILSGVTDFLFKDGAGRKLFAVLLGVCFTALFFAVIWIWILRTFKDKVIKVCLVLYHICMAGMCVWMAVWKVWTIVIIMIVFLVFTDLWIYYQRDNLPFAAVMCKIGVECVTKNCKMQCLAYCIMPFQIFTYIFWWLGLAFVLVDPDFADQWFGWFILFLFSYVWVNEVFNFVVHYFASGVSAAWCFGIKNEGKARKSFCQALTTSHGTICLAGLLMAILSIIRACIYYPLVSICCYCGNVLYNCACGCLEDIIKKVNQYVVSISSVFGLSFWESSKRLAAAFETSGMQMVTNEVAWNLPIAVGQILGGLIGGGLGVAYFVLAYHNEDDVDTDSRGTQTGVFFICFMLAFSTAKVGLSVLHSATVTTFVCWAEDSQAFSEGQKELYNELMKTVRETPVKEMVKLQDYSVQV